MTKRVICILVLCLFISSSTALATNWVKYGTSPDVDLYVDADSVVKKGDTITYWTLGVYKKPFLDDKYYIYKVEAVPPFDNRELSKYYYDETKKLTDSEPNIKYPNWIHWPENSNAAKGIATANKYAQEGQDTGQVPALP